MVIVGLFLTERVYRTPAELAVANLMPVVLVGLIQNESACFSRRIR
jgi:hypothetical protein